MSGVRLKAKVVNVNSLCARNTSNTAALLLASCALSVDQSQKLRLLKLSMPPDRKSGIHARDYVSVFNASAGSILRACR